MAGVPTQVSGTLPLAHGSNYSCAPSRTVPWQLWHPNWAVSQEFFQSKGFHLEVLAHSSKIDFWGKKKCELVVLIVLDIYIGTLTKCIEVCFHWVGWFYWLCQGTCQRGKVGGSSRGRPAVGYVCMGAGVKPLLQQSPPVAVVGCSLCLPRRGSKVRDLTLGGGYNLHRL